MLSRFVLAMRQRHTPRTNPPHNTQQTTSMTLRNKTQTDTDTEKQDTDRRERQIQKSSGTLKKFMDSILRQFKRKAQRLPGKESVETQFRLGTRPSTLRLNFRQNFHGLSSFAKSHKGNCLGKQLREIKNMERCEKKAAAKRETETHKDKACL